MAEKSLVLPITGAFNPCIKLFTPSKHGLKKAMFNPVGAAHYQRPSKALEDAGFTVESPVVLKRLGIQHPELTYEQVREQLLKRLQRNDFDRAYVLGHSLGGLMAVRALTDGIDPRIAAGITLGSPHEGADDDFFGPLIKIAKLSGFATLAGVNELMDNMQEFSDSSQAAVRANKAKLHYVASPHDTLVPFESALSRAAGAELHAVGNISEAPQDATVHQFGEDVSHTGLLTNKRVAKAIVPIVESLPADTPQTKLHAA